MGSSVRTSSLIKAHAVKGSVIYDSMGESLGLIDDIVIDRNTGNVAYAILSFGGFLGFGHRYYPLAWSTLKYDAKLGGFATRLGRSQLDNLRGSGQCIYAGQAGHLAQPR